jgi:hypothetical protein
MRTSIILCLALAAPVVACASDQNKKLEDAQKQEAENARKSAEQSAEQVKKSEMGAIEQQGEQAKHQAEALPEQSQERAKTQVAVSVERQKYITEAQTRLQKINARLQETQQKAQLARGNIPLSTTDKINEAGRLMTSVNDQINRLPQVSPAGWSDETKRVDAQLDHVESLVGDASSEVNSKMP